MNCRSEYLKQSHRLGVRGMTELERLPSVIENGRIWEVRGLVQHLLESGLLPEEVVHSGIVPGLSEIGRKFEKQEIFIPEMLLAARTAKLGCEAMRSFMGEQRSFGHKIVLGVVADDVHDIGKSLVSAAMTSVGIPVVDLGVDVSPEQFVRAVEADETVALVGVSALLTTTLPAMRDTVSALRRCSAAGRIKILVGGAPVIREFAREIGADIYTDNAFAAAKAAQAILEALPELPGK